MSYRHQHIHPRIRILRNRKKLYQKPLFWLGLLIIVCVGFMGYGIVWYEKFQVKAIEISGNAKTSEQDIQALAFGGAVTKFMGIPSKSMFLAGKGRVANALLASLPGMETVTVQKKFPNTIALTVKERQPAAIFCGQECFYIDSNGVIFEALGQLPQGFFIIRQSVHKKELLLGQQAVDATTITAVLKIAKSLRDNFQINVKEALVANPLVITTSEHWKVYFNLEGDINLQITKMNALLAQEISLTKRENLQYIYLQYKDRAYYR